MSALVARPVSKSEVKAKLAEGDRGPQDALDDEWSYLRNDFCWDAANVIDFDDLIHLGEEFHWGYLFGICVEKKSELPEGHKLRKYKGRVVFDGRRFRVRDQSHEISMFQELEPIRKNVITIPNYHLHYETSMATQ